MHAKDDTIPQKVRGKMKVQHWIIIEDADLIRGKGSEISGIRCCKDYRSAAATGTGC